MSGYIPPALRNNMYKSKKLSLKPKPIDWTQMKTQNEIMNEYKSENIGKADSAYDD